ncbi:uncharacterized protein TEOVI_000317700 [Trypanosoma equiperdum]|uniref:Uncharacterized protein n=4 Tax=Trypanozoon TaxID=39700 RepID=Q57YS7_TRYB2|nr:hypothetical protein, conserved [Trypanosoma brucei gambiense DAL972]XP_847550.1 hypothetical protein, conserved [Trypanosoma brucei brucei TREU927]AAX69241.1 hypothetical protein, conserved [Trypanosoma brucei]RHW73097.1 hypothetical protein DPX39_040045400 [Trypanosoma brucei equiperdum]SCU71596.1 hypothetical protein, conserved [Trypanosoma equiperdum]AAZ13484.1 hypothetical protein, conserved [Trypanosoma brucei brucei TREU927]CBH13804.1 hypothetical protein, conserved [Trypanosoma bru|eukprot:XP_011776080.1 hypothetical protein, conserved [Trypanosoma brucei gambiense DAL972]
MSKKQGAQGLETSPELSFIKQGHLNLLIHTKDGEQRLVPVDSLAFIDDPQLVRSRTMDQVNFNSECIFKVTLDFSEPIPCIEETAVREMTDWVLCSCKGNNAFYSPVEKRLILQSCTVCLQSNVRALVDPFVVMLLYNEEGWVVDRVLK